MDPYTQPMFDRVIAWDRPEADPCEAGTPRCAIDHTAEEPGQEGCETW